MNPVIKKSYAKINLGLKIINKRPDDFHNIKSIFIQISLHDTLQFISNNKFEIDSKGIKTPTNHENIIYKTVSTLEKEFNIQIKHKIILDKKIPIGAGLGGGSSNAAITLKTLNSIYDLNLNKKNLIEIANSIGSDVPFFIDGGTKYITGKGDIINKINYAALKNKKILLVFPNFNISTKWAYSQIKKHLDTTNKQTKFSPLTESVKWSLFDNDFEKIVCLTYPEILKIKDILYNEGALYSGLSGSGSTVFGIYNDTDKLNKIIKKFSQYHTNISLPILQ